MSIEHSILAYLSFLPSSGYDIKYEFEHEVTSLYWGISYGSIYPKLKKLEEEGLIQTVDGEQNGRNKRLYELTEKGWLEYEEWLCSSPSYPEIKDELLIKMSSWHQDMNTAHLIRHLQKRRKESQERLDFVTNWTSNGVSYVSSIGALVIPYIQMQLEAELKWITQTIENLQASTLPIGQDPYGIEPKRIARRRAALGLDQEE